MQQVVQLEEQARREVVDTKLIASVVQAEQRYAIIVQATYESNLRQARSEDKLTEARSESAPHKLKAKLRKQYAGHSSKSQDSEKSRQEQYSVQLELRSRERGHPDALSSLREQWKSRERPDLLELNCGEEA